MTLNASCETYSIVNKNIPSLLLGMFLFTLAEDIKNNIKKYPDHATSWLDTLEVINQAIAKRNTSHLNPNKGN